MSKRTATVILMTGLLLAMTGFSAPVLGPITLQNPSFEDTTGVNLMGCGGTCMFSVGPIPGWMNTGDSGQFQPGNQGFFSFLPDGITTAYSNDPGGIISQTVNVTIEAGVTYELMVDLGHRNSQNFTASADLEVGSTVIPATGTTPASGSWSTFTAFFTPPATDVGTTIPFTIQLNSSGVQANFDDVQLLAVPEPGAGGLVGLGLVGLLALATRQATPPRLKFRYRQ